MIDPIVQMTALVGDGEQKLVVLTKSGRLFERMTDARQFNGNNAARVYKWREVEMPEIPEKKSA